MHPEHDPLSSTTLTVLPVVINPQPSGKCNGQRGETNTAGKGQQVLEDGDRFCEDEGNDCETEGAGEPGDPVDHGVRLEVL